MSEKGKYKIDNEWELNMNVFNTQQQNELLKYSEGKEYNNLIIKDVLKLINRQKEKYYSEIESKRRNKIKKGIITDEVIDKQEAYSKKHLLEKFIRYGYNLDYLKSYTHLINLEYLVRLKEFIQMKDGGYLEKELSDIIIYKDIIQDFLNVIDKSIIDEYKKTNYAPEKQLYPLTMNEYMKPKKK